MHSLVKPKSAQAAIPLSAFSEVVNEDFLSCKACFKGLEDPRLLKCLHTYCFQCLKSIMRQINPLRTVIECPVCQAQTRLPACGIEGLLPNKTVTRLANTMIEDMSRGIQCTCCEFDGLNREAAYRCINCMDYLCSDCNSVHKRTRITRDHSIIELNRIREMIEGKNKLDSKEKCEGLCEHHPRLFYDATCGQALCDDCVKNEEHVSHKFESAESVARKARQDFRSILPELERNFPSINQAIDNADKALEQCKIMRQSVKDNVKTHAQLMRDIINQKEREMISEIENMSEESEKQLNKLMSDSRNMQATYVIAYKFGHQILQHSTDEEILMLKDICNERFKQLRSFKFGESIQTTQMSLHVNSKAEATLQTLCGKIVTTQKIAQPILISQFLIEINRHQDWLSGMTANQSTGDIYIAMSSTSESRNKIVIYSNSKRKNSISTNQLAGICLTREGNIVTVDRDECKVKMYTVLGQLIRSFKIQSAGGVAINSDGHIIVAGSTAINTYRRNGELMNSIGDNLYSSGHDVTTTKQIAVSSQIGDLFVSDSCNGCVRAYHYTGLQKFCYKTASYNKDDSSNPQGLCIDKQGNILIADKGSHCIHMINEQGIFCNYAIGPDELLNSPRFVAVDANGYLIVAEQNGSIKTYKYL